MLFHFHVWLVRNIWLQFAVTGRTKLCTVLSAVVVCDPFCLMLFLSPLSTHPNQMKQINGHHAAEGFLAAVPKPSPRAPLLSSAVEEGGKQAK